MRINSSQSFTGLFLQIIELYHIVKAMVMPVVVYGCESWTIKKAEHQRIDAFELSSRELSS